MFIKLINFIIIFFISIFLSSKEIFQTLLNCENVSVFKNLSKNYSLHWKPKNILVILKVQVAIESCFDENYNNSVNLIILLIETESNIIWGL